MAKHKFNKIHHVDTGENNVYHIYKLDEGHVVDSGELCWCNPNVELVYHDLTNEYCGKLIIHREVH